MMHKSQTVVLNENIILLQRQQAKDLIILKEQFHHVYESLKPINLVRNAFHEVAASPELKNNLVDIIIGLTTGYLSKKVIFGATRNPITKLIGTLFQFAITNFVSKHSDGIKSTGENILQRILKYKKEDKQELFNEKDIYS